MTLCHSFMTKTQVFFNKTSLIPSFKKNSSIGNPFTSRASPTMIWIINHSLCSSLNLTRIL